MSLAKIQFEDTYFMTQFILIKDLSKPMILRTPFLNMIKCFSVDNKGITTKVSSQDLKIIFITKEYRKDLNCTPLYEINRKNKQLEFLEKKINLERIRNQIRRPNHYPKDTRFQNQVPTNCLL